MRTPSKPKSQNGAFKRAPVEEVLRAVHGDDAEILIGRHHVRYFKQDGVYHLVSRVVAGLALLVPTDELNRIIAGVMLRGLALHTDVRLYAFAFMSNHFHLEASGGPVSTPRFMRYLKQQISLRVKAITGHEGTLWDGPYAATYLPEASDQRRAFRYILGHGVKEGLVQRPEEWPGLHCGKQLFAGEALEAEWFDGKRYSKARYKENQKPECRRRPIEREAFIELYDDLDLLERLPALVNLDDEAYASYLHKLREDIIDEGRTARGDKPALGAEAVKNLPRDSKFEMPKPPWWQLRRPMIFWGSRSSPAARAYLADYYGHQLGHRHASNRYLEGEIDVKFPKASHRPCAPVQPMARKTMDPERFARLTRTKVS